MQDCLLIDAPYDLSSPGYQSRFFEIQPLHQWSKPISQHLWLLKVLSLDSPSCNLSCIYSPTSIIHWNSPWYYEATNRQCWTTDTHKQVLSVRWVQSEICCNTDLWSWIPLAVDESRLQGCVSWLIETIPSTTITINTTGCLNTTVPRRLFDRAIYPQRRSYTIVYNLFLEITHLLVFMYSDFVQRLEGGPLVKIAERYGQACPMISTYVLVPMVQW